MILYKKGKYQIEEVEDEIPFDEFVEGMEVENIEDLKKTISEKGLYGYILSEWNEKIGCGWESIDSCWGFIGKYDCKTNAHYIVEEFLNKINGKAVNTFGMTIK